MVVPSRMATQLMSKDRRRRPPTRDRMLVIASLPREGRVQRQIRRRLIAANGRPLCSTDFLSWAYPHLERFKRWHRQSCRRALLRYAVPIGRAGGRGTPVIWAPRDMSRDMTGNDGKTSLSRKALSCDG
jgi:hypothetical protein